MKQFNAARVTLHSRFTCRQIDVITNIPIYRQQYRFIA